MFAARGVISDPGGPASAHSSSHAATKAASSGSNRFRTTGHRVQAVESTVASMSSARRRLASSACPVTSKSAISRHVDASRWVRPNEAQMTSCDDRSSGSASS